MRRFVNAFLTTTLAVSCTLHESSGFAPARLPSGSSGPGLTVAFYRRNGETSDDYFRRLQEAARDPSQFVMNQDDDDVGSDMEPVSEDFTPKGGYQRIEDWDAQRTRDDLSWEEKVQFDGQKHGNQFAQNEILRRNLRSF